VEGRKETKVASQVRPIDSKRTFNEDSYLAAIAKYF